MKIHEDPYFFRLGFSINQQHPILTIFWPRTNRILEAEVDKDSEDAPQLDAELSMLPVWNFSLQDRCLGSMGTPVGCGCQIMSNPPFFCEFSSECSEFMFNHIKFHAFTVSLKATRLVNHFPRSVDFFVGRPLTCFFGCEEITILFAGFVPLRRAMGLAHCLVTGSDPFISHL